LLPATVDEDGGDLVGEDRDAATTYDIDDLGERGEGRDGAMVSAWLFGGVLLVRPVWWVAGASPASRPSVVAFGQS